MLVCDVTAFSVRCVCLLAYTLVPAQAHPAALPYVSYLPLPMHMHAVELRFHGLLLHGRKTIFSHAAGGLHLGFRFLI